MEFLEKQLYIVSDKVDTLQAAVQQLSSTISNVLMTSQYPSDLIESRAGVYHTLSQDLSNHKDVLSDLDGGQVMDPDANSKLSTDIQIQRLTAQLTAAYGRIAALEEQLLSRREIKR